MARPVYLFSLPFQKWYHIPCTNTLSYWLQPRFEPGDPTPVEPRALAFGYRVLSLRKESEDACEHEDRHHFYNQDRSGHNDIEGDSDFEEGVA